MKARLLPRSSQTQSNFTRETSNKRGDCRGLLLEHLLNDHFTVGDRRSAKDDLEGQLLQHAMHFLYLYRRIHISSDQIVSAA
jgi:hypothetical protein